MRRQPAPPVQAKRAVPALPPARPCRALTDKVNQNTSR